MSAGINNHIGLGKETTFGTPVAPTVFAPIRESDGVNINMDKQANEAIKGTPAKNKGMFIGKVELAGGYESDVYPNFIGHFLNSALGNLSSALVGGETVVYKHTITEDLAKPSYTIEQKFGEVVKRFAGFTAQGFKVEAKTGEAVRISFEGLAKGQADASASTPTFETPRPFNFADISALNIGALSVVNQAEEVEFEYANNAQGRYALGDNCIKGVEYGQSETTGKMTLYVDNDTKDLVTDYIANTERAIEMIITGDAIGVASQNILRLYVAKAQITAISTKLSFDYNMMELEWEAVEDATDGIIKVELTNLISAY